MRTSHVARSYGCGWLVACALGGLSLTAGAAKLPSIGQASVGQSSEFGNLLAMPSAVGAGVATWPPGKMVPGGGWTMAGNYGVAAGAAAGSAKVGVDTVANVAGKQVGVQVSGTISKADIAGSVVGCATGTVVGCAIGLAPLAIGYLTLSGTRVSPTTPGQLEMVPEGVCTVAPCYEYTASQVSQLGGAYFPYGALPGEVSARTAGAVAAQRYIACHWDGASITTIKCNDYWGGVNTVTLTASRRTKEPTSPTWAPATSQEVKDRLIADAANNPPPMIVPELEKAGVDWNQHWKDPTVTGPSEFKSPEQVTVKPDGSSTTTQTKTPLSYSGPKVTAGPSVTTQTDRNSGGTTTGTTTTTSTPGNEEQPPKEDPPVQCDKYPDSLGCAELGTETGEIPKDSKTITYTAESPFGGGSCPADKMFSSGLAGRSFKAVDWVQWCSYAPMIRTLVILLATISAFFIVSLGKDAE